MSERLFSVLADGDSPPTEKLRLLARFARETLGARFVEFRLNAIGVARDAESAAPDDAEMSPARRIAIGPAEKPVGDMLISPAPADDSQLTEFARCAALIHRLQEGYIDTLTGLYNRRRLDMELAASSVSRDLLAIVMIDIDHFKMVNDTHGHDAGDAVLKEFSTRLAQHMPDGGFLARYGGEEFCALFAGIDETAAAAAAETMRLAVSAAPVRYGNIEIRITSSAGVAGGRGADSARIHKAADEALYAAKSAGRDRTTVHSANSMASSRGVASPVLRRLVVWPRPLVDLAPLGRRVVGLDRVIRRLVVIDAYGGAWPFGEELPDALSFVRVHGRTIFVPASAPGVRTVPARTAIEAGPGDTPVFRRVIFDARLNRYYAIGLTGEPFFVSDGETDRWSIAFKSDAVAAGRGSSEGADVVSAPTRATAILPLGRSLLVLDPLARSIELRDRARYGIKKRWTIPSSRYEICLCFLPSRKSVAAGGADGFTLFDYAGRVREERDEPMISACEHPSAGWVISSPDETTVMK